MAGKTVLVLGGGAGGVVAANELRSKLGREQRIVLVDRQTHHLFYPSFLWVMMGWASASWSWAAGRRGTPLATSTASLRPL